MLIFNQLKHIYFRLFGDSLAKKNKNQISDKKLSFTDIKYPRPIFTFDEENPPFEYLKEKYNLNIMPFSNIADQINEAAFVSAMELASMCSNTIKFKPNDHLAHFFFDLYLALNSDVFSSDNDIASAITDGIHFKYFGQPSLKVITTILQIWGEQPEKCFFISFFHVLNKKLPYRKLAIYAEYCIFDDMRLGLIDSSFLFKMIMALITEVSPRVKNKIQELTE